MNLTHRLLAPLAVSAQTMTVNGRGPYTATPGQALDVYDADAQVLAANGWIYVAPSGTTASRPASRLNAPYDTGPGFRYFDTTLAKLIVWDGASWRDPATGGAV